jgi:cytochrome c-type biogenesis protein CcmE
MNKTHKRRLITISLLAVGISIAAGLILYSLKQNINVFLTPAQIAMTPPPSDYHFRLGGMVKKNSVVRNKNDLAVEFTVTDLKRDLRVRYVGVLPDLFREGKGVIAEGSMNKDGIFTASQVLAKHDENYMPKNVKGMMGKKS